MYRSDPIAGTSRPASGAAHDKPPELGSRPTLRKGAAVLDQFVTYQQYRGFSRSTIERRRAVIAQFARFIEPLRLEQIGIDHLESFIGSKHAPRTKHAYRSDLKVFYAWALSHKLMKVNPSAELGSIRVPKSLPRPIEPAQALAMLWHGSLRVRRMIALALYAGLRTFEIAQLDAADLWTHAEPPVVVVRNGKGSKDRSVPMHPMLRELLIDLPSAGHLFPSSRRGRSMHPESVARAMTRHMQASGVDGTPHQLRHSFGSELANRSGGDMVLTAALMGHESMTTTLGYVRLVGGRSADVVTAMFPVVA